MARRYRKSDPRFWKDEKIRGFDPTDKLLAQYAFTGQSNRIGCFAFSPGMAAEDTGIPLKTFVKRFRQVCQQLNWKWDEELGVLYLPTWWRYNQPENANNVIGNLKDLDDVPGSPLVAEFCENVTYLDPRFRETFRQLVERLGERYPRRSATQEQEQEQETTPRADAPVTAAPLSATNGAGLADFARFWAAYPKRKNRGQAEKAWVKLQPPIDTVLSVLEVQRRSRDWVKDGGQYIPYPATWLNAKGWLDEVPADLGRQATNGGAADSSEKYPYFSTCHSCGEFHQEGIACPSAEPRR
jgi:hypothetical protein